MDFYWEDFGHTHLFGKDKLYPCEAVRASIEKYADENMISEYKIAMFNQRGVFSFSAGREERL